MTGTALLINEDRTVRVLENIAHDLYNDLLSQENRKNVHCVIDDKEVHFGSITKVVWYEDSIDWNYGY